MNCNIGTHRSTQRGYLEMPAAGDGFQKIIKEDDE